MIERNKQYISLRRYGTAFLDAFSFYPIDYFGCVGDNLQDNYRQFTSSSRRNN